MINHLAAGFIPSERFPRTWVGLTGRWDSTLCKTEEVRGDRGASCFSKPQALFWMPAQQQYPRPGYNSLVSASLPLSQSRHIQQTPQIRATAREGREGCMSPPSWGEGMRWGGRRRRGTSERGRRGNQWKPSKEPSGFGQASEVPVPNDGPVSTTWSRGRQAPREEVPKTLSPPAWIVGLRGLWPSTKIWLSQPWRGWLCLWRFAPPSVERCSSLFRAFLLSPQTSSPLLASLPFLLLFLQKIIVAFWILFHLFFISPLSCPISSTIDRSVFLQLHLIVYSSFNAAGVFKLILKLGRFQIVATRCQLRSVTSTTI